MTISPAEPEVQIEQKILIFNNNSIMREIIKATLRQLGLHDLRKAVNGKTALAWLSRQTFYLVVSDWPTVALNRLKVYKNTFVYANLKELWFLLLTAKADAAGAEHINAAGIQDFLAKPFSCANSR